MDTPLSDSSFPECVPSSHLVIITGLSGAGKSTAMRVFEDMGYCCVDNLPPGLILDFYALYRQSRGNARGVVVASDVRSGALFDDFLKTIQRLRDNRVDHTIVYLDCSEEVLVRRFKEVRRSHPLEPAYSMTRAIAEERRRLAPILESAAIIFDTSRMTPKGLRDKLLCRVIGGELSKTVRINFTSFGFKYGMPLDADYVLDVRFLPNPFYRSDLKSLTGETPPVYDYVMSQSDADPFFRNVVQMLDLTFAGFKDVGKFSVTVALGCTGGQHRSVAFARRLASHYEADGRQVMLTHRDMGNAL